MTTPTSNPVPSSAPQDLLFNAALLDQVVTGPGAAATDRLGITRMTMQGAVDTLKAFNARGAWVTGTVYALKDVATTGGIAYAAVLPHTAGTFATDLAAGRWVVHQGVVGADLASTASGKGAAMVGLAAGLNYALQTVGWQATQEVHVGLFAGYDATSGADNTAVLAAAHAFAASLPLGATLVIPRGNMTVSALPNLVSRVNWRGYGRLSSQIVYTGTGDGIAYLTATVNTYDSIRITLKDFTLSCNNVSNVGAGFKFQSCAYVHMENVIVEKFKYGLLLDGTAHFWMSYCEFLQQSRASIWIVNGNELRGTQTQGYTNNLWIGPEIQLNNNALAGVIGIQDDGGVNHHYWGVNFNAGDIAARFAGVRGLIYHNNPHESYLQTPLFFSDLTREGNVRVGSCSAVDVRVCTFSNNSPFAIAIGALESAVFEANMFAIMSSACFTFGTQVRDIRIAKNSKLVTSASRSAAPFFDATINGLAAAIDIEDQVTNTYAAASLLAGTRTVTPASMDLIKLGESLYVSDADGTTPETVLVTAVSAATFTATFANNHSANFVIKGQGARFTEGLWAPTVFGTTTAGANTYSAQQGTWKRDKRTGMVEITATLTMSVKDAAMAGNIEIAGLPFPAQNTTGNRNGGASFNYYSGLMFPAGFTQLSGLIGQNASRVALRRLGSGSVGAGVAASEIAAGAVLSLTGTYYTH